jgi:hypothetical protein
MGIETQTATESEKEQEVQEALETVEETTEATEENEEAVSEDGAEDSEAAEEKPKKLGGYKKKLMLAKQEADYWREQALKKQEPVNDGPKAVEAEPDPNKFENPADYYKALGKWTVAQERAELEKARLKEESEKTQAVKAESYKSRLEEFSKAQPDYQDVVEDFDLENPGFQWNQTMRTLLADSEVGPAAVYAMAKDPAIAKRLNSLSPLEAAKEFGKLEEKLSKPKTVVKKSTASAPLKPISGTKTEIKKSIYDENSWSNLAEYEALRRTKRA